MLLGRYQVQRVIQRGGIAEVFEARAVGENGFLRGVAIKRLLREFTSDESVRRAFLDEARIASGLSHPNIVGILDFGSADGLPFQVLELVDGSDLASLCRRQPVPPLVAVHVVGEVARALEYAHRACDERGEPLGIVHRDVTPQNVLISWNGEVKLSDFGVARARARLEETGLGVIKGTLAYMAPEQARGAAVDGRTDLFSLGCVLHRLIAGESPLEETNARQKAIAGGAIVIDPRVPDEIAAIIRRATRPRKEERYPNAGAMVEVCWEYLAKQADRDWRKMLRDWLAELAPNFGSDPATTNLFELEVSGEDASGFRQFNTVSDTRLVSAPAPVEGAPQPRLSGALMVAIGLSVTTISAIASTVVMTSTASVPVDSIAAPPAPRPIVSPSVTPRPQVESVLLPPPKPEAPRRKLARFRASVKAELPSIEVAPGTLAARLRQILARLKVASDRIPRDDLASLEARYFDLRERSAGALSSEDRRLLLQEIETLERDTSRAER